MKAIIYVNEIPTRIFHDESFEVLIDTLVNRGYILIDGIGEYRIIGKSISHILFFDSYSNQPCFVIKSYNQSLAQRLAYEFPC